MARITESLKVLAIPLASIRLDPKNARKHPKANIAVIKRSLETYGQRKPIVVNARTGIIEAGNGLYMAAKVLGWTEIAAIRVEDDEAMATGYALMDNQSALLAEWDLPVLKELLEELDRQSFDLETTGFGEDEILKLLGPKEGNIPDDEIPEEAEPVCKRGDLWQLGDHRLLCGDATNQADVERLMGGVKADMIFTDPPYGISIVRGLSAIGGAKPFGRVRQPGGKPSGVVGGKGIVKPRLYRPVIGDDKPFDPQPFLSLVEKVILFGANHYASRLPDAAGWIVWDKGVSPDSTFSACELAWANFGNHVRRYEHRWSGMVRAGDRKEELEDRVHPTQKPVGLCVQILTDCDASSILDPFGGSGSTLIACEKLNRKCYMMEIDEHYCDVILQRWQNFTGKQAVKLNG